MENKGVIDVSAIIEGENDWESDFSFESDDGEIINLVETTSYILEIGASLKGILNEMKIVSHSGDLSIDKESING